MAKSIDELDTYINSKIQGVFGKGEIQVLRDEIQKLKPGDIYVEIGTDEGKSARVAHEYAHPDVYKLWIDINDPDPRGKFMQDEGMVGIGKRGFWIHGDADVFSQFLEMFEGMGGGAREIQFIDLLFIDGHHNYESVKENTLRWEKFVKRSMNIRYKDSEGQQINNNVTGGVILFHDYDHPDVKRWLDEYYGDKKEVFFNKIVKVKV